MNWRDTALARRLGIRLPILQAPMAGGWTTPMLVAQVCEAGGLGAIAGAALPPDVLRAEIAAVRSLTAKPFAVNLFAPLPPPSDRGLAGWALLSGVPVPTVPRPAFRFEDQLAVVVDERVPVLSFTFGMPPLAGVDCFTIGTATTVAEAVALADAGSAPWWHKAPRRAGTAARSWRRSSSRCWAPWRWSRRWWMPSRSR
jgi:nitronate monooxygenase